MTSLDNPKLLVRHLQLKTMAHSISESQSLGNIDEITQSISTLSALITTATVRKIEAENVEKRMISARFHRRETHESGFMAELQLIADTSTQNKLIARAATVNITFLNARVAALRMLKSSIIREKIQTENLARLAVEYKNSVDLREQAILDRANALKAFLDALKLIETTPPVPTIALFDAMCVSLGAPTGSAILVEPVPPVTKPACPHQSIVYKLVYCNNPKCSNLVIKQVQDLMCLTTYCTECNPDKVDWNVLSYNK